MIDREAPQRGRATADRPFWLEITAAGLGVFAIQRETAVRSGSSRSFAGKSWLATSVSQKFGQELIFTTRLDPQCDGVSKLLTCGKTTST